MENYEAVKNGIIAVYQTPSNMAWNNEALRGQQIEETMRPSIMLRDCIKIMPDGDMWCVLFGKDLQEGVAGFGKSPDLAMRDFDKSWYEEKS